MQLHFIVGRESGENYENNSICNGTDGTSIEYKKDIYLL
jgi:hypothetical protein